MRQLIPRSLIGSRCTFPLLALIAAFVVQAQDRAALTGTINDSSGALVEGATVVLTAPSKGLYRKTMTKANGIYEFSSLAVGSYNLFLREGWLGTGGPW